MLGVKCPICHTIVQSLNLVSRLIEEPILICNNCDYSFINCVIFSSEEIYKHQNSNQHRFGHNLERNNKYLNLLLEKRKDLKINKLLEIGTPRNHDFLSKVHEALVDKIKLYSYDLIKSDLPDYINFYNDKEKLLGEGIDILFCIHTLEHIPTDELLGFVEFCKNVSRYFVFEVPYCNTLQRVLESTTNPHYSFFTERAIKCLFGSDIQVMIGNKTIAFTNYE